jgi:hypothetical protein
VRYEGLKSSIFRQPQSGQQSVVFVMTHESK